MAGIEGIIGEKVVEKGWTTCCGKVVSYRVESSGKADVAAT